jgi:hypothetical protein
MEDGAYCKAPALRGRRFCYFHCDPDARTLKVSFARAYLALRAAKMRNRDSRRHSTKRK